jgi:NAD(P)-dependent dehydrogenase (short-subunit alcohol dehydrogenase family)
MHTPKTAVVTGGASGMGRLVVERLLDQGVTVTAVDRNGRALDALPGHDGLRIEAVDVTDDEAVQRLVEGIVDESGPVDRLVLAAGIASGGPLLDADRQRFRATMEVNYLGVVNWVRAVVPSMIERGTGEIVIFASTAGWVPTSAMAGYCASKAALVSFSESIALELEPQGVRVVALCPPAVETPMLNDFVAAGALPRKGLKYFKPISPETVVDAIEPALAGKKIFCFPGRGTTTIQRARRFVPGLTRRALRFFDDG